MTGHLNAKCDCRNVGRRNSHLFVRDTNASKTARNFLIHTNDALIEHGYAPSQQSLQPTGAQIFREYSGMQRQHSAGTLACRQPSGKSHKPTLPVMPIGMEVNEPPVVC